MVSALVLAGEVSGLCFGVVFSVARWVTVAQREHYEPGRVTRFARLWATSSVPNVLLPATGIAAAASGWFLPGRWSVLATLGAVIGVAWPIGFRLRWRKGGIRGTARLKRLMAVAALVVVALAAAVRQPARLMLLPLLMPLFVDASLLIVLPLENRLGHRYVVAAQRKLKRLGPRIVAITGSYGKTSTKGYVTHLAGPDSGVVASPASFNNLMGLARSVNERLHSGDGVFVAEMGTYGPGEIRKLCELFPPDVAAITTIGEAHLERMGSRSNVLRAKAEITEKAGTVVLNVDTPELADLAAELGQQKRVIRVSGGLAEAEVDAEIVVQPDATDGNWRVRLPGQGEPSSLVPPPSGHTGNLAVALGVGLAIGLAPEEMLKRMQSLPTADHRAQLHTLPTGITLIDDTYNSNPIGAAAALDTASRAAGSEGTVWVITPGMVELGAMQEQRNTEWGRCVGALPGARLIVTHRVNRRSLVAGAADAGGHAAIWYASRDVAAAEVMAAARSGDVVLFENDLPDHYP